MAGGLALEVQPLWPEEVAEVWDDQRTKNAVPGKKSSAKIDLTVYQQEESFAEFASEGDFLPLNAWLSEIGQDPNVFTSDAHKMQYAKDMPERYCFLSFADHGKLNMNVNLSVEPIRIRKSSL